MALYTQIVKIDEISISLHPVRLTTILRRRVSRGPLAKSLKEWGRLDRAIRTGGCRRCRHRGTAGEWRRHLLARALASNIRGRRPVGVETGIGANRGEHSRTRNSSAVARTQWNLATCVVRRSDLAARGSASAVIIGSNLGLNATSMRSRTNLWKNRPDSLNKTIFLMRSGKFESCLYDIIGE